MRVDRLPRRAPAPLDRGGGMSSRPGAVDEGAGADSAADRWSAAALASARGWAGRAPAANDRVVWALARIGDAGVHAALAGDVGRSATCAAFFLRPDLAERRAAKRRWTVLSGPCCRRPWRA